VIVPAFHPVAVMQAIERHRVDTALLVPTMLQMVVYHPDVRKQDLTSLRHLIYAASPIQEKVLHDTMALLPGVKLFQAYGQTELAPLVSILGPEHHTPQGSEAGMLRSCGRATLAVEVRIVDANGNEVPRGTVGEIAVRGPNVMQGYWNKSEQSKAALPGDGWLRTGDGAYMDENGYLFIVDRMKDMIVTGGENVFSAEVENALASHPDVAMCAVIGIPTSSGARRSMRSWCPSPARRRRRRI
jgi:acyl-CoA synthetase (AMP-forming)/AMP-acid ligase II